LAKVAAAAGAFVLAFVRIPQNDVIHIHAAWKTSFCRKTVFFVMARCFRKKTVLHLHAPDFAGFQKGLMRTLGGHVFSKADAVIALSETWARDIRTIAPSANVQVVPNPCEIPARRPRPLADRKPIVVFSGKLEPRKGFPDLIRAMPAVIARVPDARLVMAGHGAIGEAQTLAGRLGIADRVECLGWITGERKADVLSGARVFCLPSYGEGLPMAMLDAMSQGTPVVVTPVGGIPDVVTDGHNGTLVKPGDIAGISAAITSLMLDTNIAQDMAEAALDTLRSRFSPDQVGLCLRRLYDGLLRTDADGSSDLIEYSDAPAEHERQVPVPGTGAAGK
jgi:glycosyltransferase involved in cell wall biosynthesis